MGGPVPLGYDVRDRKLVVNDAEAATVRHIFERYVALGSVTTTLDALARESIVTEVGSTRDGGTRGGNAFTRGSLAHLLGNRIYLGEIRHKLAHCPGEHHAIVLRELWDRVEMQLVGRRADRRSPRNLHHGNLLGGLLYDGLGRPMRTCSAGKASRTYHYYASSAEAGQRGTATAWRMPAHDLEILIFEGVQAMLRDPGRVHAVVAEFGLDNDGLTAVLAAAGARANDAESSACRDLIERIEVHNDRVDIYIAVSRLHSAVTDDIARLAVPTHLLSLPTVRLRRGKEVRLLIPSSDGALQASPDPALIKLLAGAFAARAVVDITDNDRTLSEIAKAQGYSLEYFALLLRLSMLAPDIVAASHDGRQPPALNRQRLARSTNLPIEWSAQRVALGFP